MQEILEPSGAPSPQHVLDRDKILKFKKDGYIVHASSQQVMFQRNKPPRGRGQIIRESDWEPTRGEVFLGAPGEAIINLTWPDGQPDEELFCLTVGAFEADLLDWREWLR
jgi:hypothetical protein